MTPTPLPPGRELDALVAEKVMGWTRRVGPDDPVPCYSTDIAAVWEVVVEMGKRGKPMGVYQRGKKWRAHCPVASNTWFDADTAPHAISLAALQAVGHEVPE